MASPITWRNVEAPSFDGASRMLAQVGINSIFDPFKDILNKAQATADANWKQQKENNTNAYMAELLSAKTPEELASKQEFLNQMRSQMGAQLDVPAVLKATDERIGQLQQRGITSINYNNAMENQATAADQAAYKVAYANGDTATMKEIADRNVGKQWIGDAAVAGEKALREQIKFGQDNVTFGNQLVDHEQKVKLFPGQLTAQNDAHLISMAQRKLLEAEAQAKLAEPGVKAAKALKDQTEEQLKIFHSDNAYGNKNFSTDPAKNVGIIAESVKGILGKASPDAAQKITQFVAENPYVTVEDSSGNKEQLPLNSSVVSRAIHLVDSGKKDSKIPFMSSDGYGDDYVSAVKNKIQELMSAGAKEGSSDSMLNSYATLKQLTANQLRGGVAGAPATSGSASPTAASPKAEQPAPTSVTAAIDRAAEAAKSAAPANASPATKAQTDRASLLQGLGLVGDAVAYPGRAFSDIVGSGVNAVGRVVNAVAGSDVIPAYQSSLGQYGLTPMYNAAKKANGVTNAPADQPKVSAPMAGNVGQAKVPVVASHGVAYTDAGVPIPVDAPAPSKAAVKSLSSTPEVISTYVGSIPKGEGTKVRVTVGDGDTFKFNPSDSNQKVPNAVGNICRFDVIDAPETAHPSVGKKGQPGGEEAAAYLRNLIDNKEVTIKVFGQDSRKDNGPPRNICQVEIEGKAVDLEMVKAGFATVFDQYISPNNPRYADLKKAENRARTNKLGMFEGGGYVESPAEFRRRQNRLSN